MFKNFKIGKKLLLGSITIVLIFLAINSISFVNLRSFEKQSDLDRIEKYVGKDIEGLE